MKKSFKTIISFILVLMMSFSIVTSSLAANSKVPSDNYSCAKIGENSYAFTFDDSGVVLTSEDLDNGDATFSLSQNGTVVSTSYVDRSNSTVAYTSYRNDTSNVAVNSYFPQSVISSTASRMALMNNYVGRIRYSTNGGISSASLYNNATVNTSSQYNLNGNYQDMLALAGWVAGLLTLPSAVAIQAVIRVMGYLGIAIGTVALFIPDCWVRATQTTMTWTVYNTNNFSQYNTFSGDRYDITQVGVESNTYYTGEYYLTSDYTNHNILLAQTVFWYLFAGPYSIYAWS